MSATMTFRIALLGMLLMAAGVSGAGAIMVDIYRSVGPGNTTALANGTGNRLNLPGDFATFESALPDNVGVGDVIQYNNNNNLCFICGRNNGAGFWVQDSAGNSPAPAANDTSWFVFRAYTSLYDASIGAENTGIVPTLRNFDTWSGGKDLIPSHETWNIACYGDAPDQPSANIVFAGWTTGPDNYLRIYTPWQTTEVGASQRHRGIWTPGAYRIEAVDRDGITVLNGANHLRFEGLQIRMANITNAGAEPIYVAATGATIDAEFSHNILRGTTNTAYATYGINAYCAGWGTLKIWNNIFYDFKGSNSFGLSLANANAALTFYVSNNTVYNCDLGMAGCWAPSLVAVLKNNLVQACTQGYSGIFDAASRNNLSHINDAPGANSQNSKVVSFVNSAGADHDLWDFHLANTDPAARDAGLDLSGDAGNVSFTDDIDGQTRPIGSAWDIGADECNTSAPSPVQPTAVTHVVIRQNQLYPESGQPVAIDVKLDTPQHVTVRIYNRSGQLIKTVCDEVKNAGTFEETWRGVNENGAVVGSGVYLIQIKTDTFQEIRKMVVIR